MNIQIEIPDNCRRCPCHRGLESFEDGINYTYHICSAFAKVLTVSLSGSVTLKVNRCQECINSEINEVVGRNISE